MRFLFVLLGLSSFWLSGCTAVPDKVTPVTPFELSRYLGTWTEIARLDHSFEKDLMQVTATYSMREDGGVKVVNRGVNVKTGEAKEAIGKAYFVEDANIGRLKVSFFGPFYGGYNIAKLDPDYSMALIIGPSLDYAWILARNPNPSAEQCQAYFAKAQDIGIKQADWIAVQGCGASQ
ncbi:MAG: lipocalin family protein [Thiotrichales bacterium]|nr:lipocalin family protein [Thiotrichales bacterium]